MKKKIISIFMIFLISFILLEFALRIAARYSFGIRRLCYYRYDKARLDHISDLKSLIKKAPYPLKPYENIGGFILNSKGLRTPEYKVKKNKNTKRVVFIGDSFTFSSNVPYPFHFTVILQNKLNKWLNYNIEVINLGVPNVGPQYEQKMLELEAILLKPDLIIWAFFVGNDFTDPCPKKKFSLKQKVFEKSFVCRLLRNGYILSIYRKILSSHKMNDNGKTVSKKGGIYIGTTDDYDSDKPTMIKSDFIKTQADRMIIHTKKSFPWFNWRTLQHIFLEVKDTCRYFKIPLLVVIIPDENQINPNVLKEVSKQLDKNIDDFSMDFPQILLTNFFKNNDIDYLDLLPLFRKVGTNQQLYKLQDTHWNIDGNLLAANSIFQYLQNTGIFETEQ